MGEERVYLGLNYLETSAVARGQVNPSIYRLMYARWMVFPLLPQKTTNIIQTEYIMCEEAAQSAEKTPIQKTENSDSYKHVLIAV